MKKRVVVAGCRQYDNYEEAKEFIDDSLENFDVGDGLIFVSGGCRGSDRLGERYAREHGYPIERYLPDWEQYGKGAGPIRNREMALVADLVICFWDGKSRGTKSMIDCARKNGKPVCVMLCGNP